MIANSFFIFRSSDGGSEWQRVGVVERNGAGSYEFDDGGLLPGTTYHYKVQAVGSDESISEYSNTDSDATNGSVPAQEAGNGIGGVKIVAYISTITWYEPLGQAEDWTPFVTDAIMSTNNHGYSSLTIDVDLPEDRVADWYERTNGYIHVITPDGRVMWEGKIYDLAYKEIGLSVVAYGAWSQFEKLLFTGLFSVTLYDEWQVLPLWAHTELGTNYDPQLFETDMDGHLYITPKESSIAMIGGQRVAIGFAGPYTDHYYWRPNRILFDYEQVWTTTSTPAGSYPTVKLYEVWRVPDSGAAGTALWATGSQLWTLTGDGTTQSGSVAVSGAFGVNGFYFAFNPVTSTTYAGQTGTEYINITNVRILGGYFHNDTNMYAHNILKTLIFTSTDATQLIRRDYSGLTTTTTDLENVVYEDESFANIIKQLAEQEGFEAGVWEDRRLEFRAKGSQAQSWVLEVDDLELEVSADTVYGRNYVKYKVKDHTFRTSQGATPNEPGGDLLSRRLYGDHMQKVDHQTDVEATAESIADDTRDAHSLPIPRARLKIVRVQNQSGGTAQKWDVRAGDYVQITPVGELLDRDSSLSYLVGSTDYDILSDELSVSLERLLPTMESVLAY